MKNDAFVHAESPRKKASECLKIADRLLKAGQLADALHEVEQALTLDPENVYAQAFQRRIKLVMEQAANASLDAAVLAAREEGIAEAKNQKIQEYLSRFDQLVLKGSIDEAIVEMMKLQALGYPELEVKKLEERVREEKKQLWKKEITEAGKRLRQNLINMYANVLKRANVGEGLTAEAQSIIHELRNSLKITEEEHRIAEQSARERH